MKYAFVIGMGRSGTKFLGNLLKLDPKVSSHHEAIGDREFWLLSHYLGQSYSVPYLRQAKRKIEEHTSNGVYVDVNSYLQNSVESLQTVFKGSEIFHLVRDPRKVVPSIYLRRDDGNMHKVPKNQEDIGRWLNMNKFEQVCFNWADTTQTLLSYNLPLIHFEKMITDYDYLYSNVLQKLGVEISPETFSDFSSKKVNRTRGVIYRYLYAKYKGKNFNRHQLKFEDFDKEQLEAFNDICGPVMSKIGYM